MPPIRPEKKAQTPAAPTVRLVAHSHQGEEVHKALSPSVRLAVTIEGGKETSPVGEEAMARHLGKSQPPIVRLAHVPGAQGDNNLLGQRGVDPLPPESRPALLVSYVYLEPFLEWGGSAA